MPTPKELLQEAIRGASEAFLSSPVPKLDIAGQWTGEGKAPDKCHYFGLDPEEKQTVLDNYVPELEALAAEVNLPETLHTFPPNMATRMRNYLTARANGFNPGRCDKLGSGMDGILEELALKFHGVAEQYPHLLESPEFERVFNAVWHNEFASKMTTIRATAALTAAGSPPKIKLGAPLSGQIKQSNLLNTPARREAAEKSGQWLARAAQVGKKPEVAAAAPPIIDKIPAAAATATKVEAAATKSSIWAKLGKLVAKHPGKIGSFVAVATVVTAGAWPSNKQQVLQPGGDAEAPKKTSAMKATAVGIGALLSVVLLASAVPGPIRNLLEKMTSGIGKR